MYEETQMEKTFRKLKRLEEMLHDRMFIPVDQVEMSVWTTKKPVHEVPDRVQSVSGERILLPDVQTSPENVVSLQLCIARNASGLRKPLHLFRISASAPSQAHTLRFFRFYCTDSA